jgi:hypothetical protein
MWMKAAKGKGRGNIGKMEGEQQSAMGRAEDPSEIGRTEDQSAMGRAGGIDQERISKI